jgi:lysophospholipase L1-like esterase
MEPRPPAAIPDSRATRIAKQVLRRSAFYPFLIASLLVFPAWMPWMVAGWLAAAAVRLGQKRPVWPPLSLGLAFILIKRVDGGPRMIVLLIALLAAIGIDAAARRKPAWSRAVRPVFGVLIAAWGFFAWDWQRAEHTSRHPVLQPDRPVVLLGDSLSSGGLGRVLQGRLKVPLVDLARGGITSADGVKSIPDLLKAKPQAVILELGGHDSLRGRRRADAKENLEKIISAAREGDAEVILFEIPLGFISDPYAGLDRELARTHDLELISDGAIRQLVYFSPFTPLGRWTGRVLSYDGLHPNDAGNAFLADRVEAALVRIYGPAIQR